MSALGTFFLNSLGKNHLCFTLSLMEINNCSSCGGKVEFSPKDKGLKCVKCQCLQTSCSCEHQRQDLHQVQQDFHLKDFELHHALLELLEVESKVSALDLVANYKEIAEKIIEVSEKEFNNMGLNYRKKKLYFVWIHNNTFLTF